MSLNTFRQYISVVLVFFDKMNLTLEYSMHGLVVSFQEINGVTRKGNGGVG